MRTRFHALLNPMIDAKIANENVNQWWFGEIEKAADLAVVEAVAVDVAVDVDDVVVVVTSDTVFGAVYVKLASMHPLSRIGNTQVDGSLMLDGMYCSWTPFR